MLVRPNPLILPQFPIGGGWAACCGLFHHWWETWHHIHQLKRASPSRYQSPQLRHCFPILWRP
ncbi:hypothetical protein GY527_001280 [Escherichia coli]|nr:hypothetical protein [Escherichia coli]EFI3604910.1 hypothetical protein [Escherichia coli]EFI4427455.1 hypothetical protein [Escherichia coli]EFI4487746.1 hypothetical protein [Escherichia coli]EFI5474922.1 hypothetical protein [Escherichia coli]